MKAFTSPRLRSAPIMSNTLLRSKIVIEKKNTQSNSCNVGVKFLKIKVPPILIIKSKYSESVHYPTFN